MLFSQLPRTFEACLRDVLSAKANIRRDAVRELARYGKEHRTQVLSLLERLLRDDEAPVVRAECAIGLGDLGAAECLPALLVAIEDEHLHVREMAIQALGEIGDARAAPRIFRALSADAPEVRFQAIMAVARVGNDKERAFSALLEVTNGNDEKLVHIALRMIEELLETTEGLPVDELATKLPSLLQHPDETVRVIAAILAAKLRQPLGHDVLIQVAKRSIRTPMLDDEVAAIELCGVKQLKESIPYLEKRAIGLFGFKRDAIAFHARIALAALGHEKAKHSILSDLDSQDRETVRAAIVAAGRAHLVEAKEVLLRKRGHEPSLEDVIAESLRELP